MEESNTTLDDNDTRYDHFYKSILFLNFTKNDSNSNRGHRCREIKYNIKITIF